jgi:aspartyl-tRNA synthetase
MYRTHTCGELTIAHVNEEVTLSGWVQRTRDLGGMTFVDLRDRYGITQLVFNEEEDKEMCEVARLLQREFVVQIKGVVAKRESENNNMTTGKIEVLVKDLKLIDDADILPLELNNKVGESYYSNFKERLTGKELPPFTIEDRTDGGEELRMKYRYLDLRRQPLQRNMRLRHELAQAIRNYLSDLSFLEIETPMLIKSTPEGARDFVVPSRMNEGQFYALPQSPQTFKQLLMVSGFDRYFQIVKCFRDEDLRADRQPEFTQIDCEMSFVRREDVINTFEGLMKHLFKKIKNIDLSDFPIMTYQDAMRNYGSDKPDLRFDMAFVELNDLAQNKGFKVFDDAELVVGICVKGAGEYSRKQLDQLTEFVKKQQVGGKGLVYVKCNTDGSFKSSVDKFFDQNQLASWAEKMNATAGDLLLVVSGEVNHSRSVLNDLRLEMASQLGLRDPKVFKPLWVVDFPLLEKEEESGRYHAMHHPFTSYKRNNEELAKIEAGELDKLIANAYDLVINGVEIGGGSIRITDQKIQEKMFEWLGFTKEEADAQFGFLMNAFRYGTPPHGGIALGFDRMCALFGGQDSIRDFIAFPKNNAGRDVMIDAPASISAEQLTELGIAMKPQA